MGHRDWPNFMSSLIEMIWLVTGFIETACAKAGRNSCLHVQLLYCLQLYDNSMIAAGLVDDPRKMLPRLTDILTQALDKHWIYEYFELIYV